MITDTKFYIINKQESTFVTIEGFESRASAAEYCATNSIVLNPDVRIELGKILIMRNFANARSGL